MANTSLHAYFKLNNANQYAFVDELIAELYVGIPALPDNAPGAQKRQALKLYAARRKFYATAIAKGVNLSRLPDDVASWNAHKLLVKTKGLPDKVSLGSRQMFAEAATRRSPEALWNNLFVGGLSDLQLPLFGDAKSVDDKIAAYIEEHNGRAPEKLAAARATDNTNLAIDPQAHPRAGRDIEERKIRRNPDDPSKLETLDPNAKREKWLPGPKLGKFLQEHDQWELYDIFQRENSQVNPTVTSGHRYAALKVLSNRDMQSADEFFESNSLRVIISRDPQKIGEMSSEQRWSSCMSEGGINFQYVPRDIEVGTLVAYVVGVNDPEARYPLMRQLLKPFHNQGGETILVPSKIYGGEGMGSSQTRDALSQTLLRFVGQQNADKSGEFAMDQRLYADGQATTAVLRADWTVERVKEALRDYRTRAIQEWFTELRYSEIKLAHYLKNNTGQDPSPEIKSLKSKIRRVQEAENKETGLPRMFFLEVQRTSIGSLPTPAIILAAIKDDALFSLREFLFKALEKNDFSSWEKRATELPPPERLQALLEAAAIADKGSPSEQQLASLWAREIRKEQIVNFTQDELDVIFNHAKTTAAIGSPLQKAVFQFILDHTGKTGIAEQQVDAAVRIMPMAAEHVVPMGRDCPNEYAQACERALSTIPSLPFEDRRRYWFNTFFQSLVKTKGHTPENFAKTLTCVRALPTAEERHDAAKSIVSIARMGDKAIARKTYVFMLTNIPAIEDPRKRANYYGSLAIETNKFSCQQRAYKAFWKELALLDPLDRIEEAKDLIYWSTQREEPIVRQNAALAGIKMRADILALPTAQDRIKAAEIVLRYTLTGDLHNYGQELLWKSLDEIPEGQKRLNQIKFFVATGNPIPHVKEKLHERLFLSAEHVSPTEANEAALWVLKDVAYDSKEGNKARTLIYETLPKLGSREARLESFKRLSPFSYISPETAKADLEKISSLFPIAQERFAALMFLGKNIHSSANNALSGPAYEAALALVPTLPTAQERYTASQGLADLSSLRHAKLVNDARSVMLDNLDGLSLPHERHESALIIGRSTNNDNLLQKRAYSLALEEGAQIPQQDVRLAAIMAVGNSAYWHSDITDKATHLLVEQSKFLHFAPTLLSAATTAISWYSSAAARVKVADYILENLSKLEKAKERVDTALSLMNYYARDLAPEQIEKACKLILRDVPRLDTTIERIKAASIVAGASAKKSRVRNRANRFIVRNIARLNSAEDRVRAIEGFWDWSSSRNGLQNQLHNMALRDVYQLQSPEERADVLRNVAARAAYGSSIRRRAQQLIEEYREGKTSLTTRVHKVLSYNPRELISKNALRPLRGRESVKETASLTT